MVDTIINVSFMIILLIPVIAFMIVMIGFVGSDLRKYTSKNRKKSDSLKVIK